MFFFKKKKSEGKSEKIKNTFPTLPTTRVISERILGTAVDKTNIVINGNKTTTTATKITSDTITMPRDSAIDGCGISSLRLSYSSIKEPSLNEESSDFKELQHHHQQQPNCLLTKEKLTTTSNTDNNSNRRDSLSSLEDSNNNKSYFIENQKHKNDEKESIIIVSEEKKKEENAIFLTTQQQQQGKDKKEYIGNNNNEQNQQKTCVQQVEEESWGISKEHSSSPNLRLDHYHHQQPQHPFSNDCHSPQQRKEKDDSFEKTSSLNKTSSRSNFITSANNSSDSKTSSDGNDGENELYARLPNMEVDILQQQQYKLSLQNNSENKEINKDIMTETEKDEQQKEEHLDITKEYQESKNKKTMTTIIPKPTTSTPTDNNSTITWKSPTRLRGPRIPRLATKKISPPSPPQSPITTSTPSSSHHPTTPLTPKPTASTSNKSLLVINTNTTTSTINNYKKDNINNNKKIPPTSHLPVPIGPTQKRTDIRKINNNSNINKSTTTSARCGLPVACTSNYNTSSISSNNIITNNTTTSLTKLPVRRAS
ncbi:hypothetical protein INT45_004959 [Circinella minor]|uniref:Uncharacterized protein n=1 Tax=Circinella minor TaxID=1195481 RepID=A0A8H7VPJ7_9FUNG|nr:hypothetical protein INT45_004959 [Circinella minor]